MDARQFRTTGSVPVLLSVKGSHVDKIMLPRGPKQNILLLQAGWRMEIVHYLLPTLGPSTSLWPPLGQQRPPFTEYLKGIQACLLKVFYSVSHDMVGRFLTAPRGGARLRSPFMWGEVPLPVSPFCMLPHQRLPRPGNRGMAVQLCTIQDFKFDSIQLQSDGSTEANLE